MSKTVIIQNTINQLATTLPIEKQQEFLINIGLNSINIITKKTKSGIVYFVEK